jgi:hypothetical protein
MAFLVGVGAAAAVGGAVLGTLFPQVEAAASLVDIETGIALVGTVFTLVYFQFSVRAGPDETPQRNQVVEVIGWGGQAFIAVTFGVIFAGVYAAALTALIERVGSVLEFFNLFL